MDCEVLMEGAGGYIGDMDCMFNGLSSLVKQLRSSWEMALYIKCEDMNPW